MEYLGNVHDVEESTALRASDGVLANSCYGCIDTRCVSLRNDGLKVELGTSDVPRCPTQQVRDIQYYPKRYANHQLYEIVTPKSL